MPSISIRVQFSGNKVQLPSNAIWKPETQDVQFPYGLEMAQFYGNKVQFFYESI